jgi:hypothetical protein
VRNSEGTEAHSGTRFGGLGRVRVESTMSRTVSNEGSMLVLRKRVISVDLSCRGFVQILLWVPWRRCMLCHGARGGDKNETAHGSE